MGFVQILIVTVLIVGVLLLSRRVRSERSKSQLLYKTEDAEGYQLGPIRLERSGRLVSMSSFASEEMHSEIRKRILKTRPRIRRSIDKKISKLQRLLRKVDAANLVGELALINLIFYGGEETSGEYKGPTVVDYVLSIALAHEYYKAAGGLSEKDVTRIQSLAREILMSSSYYFGSELADHTLDNAERDLRFFMMQRQLLGRGDAYAMHELDTIVDILTPLDSTLYEKYGFRSGDVRNLVSQCRRSFQEKLRADAEKMGAIKQAHEMFKDYCKDTKMGQGMSEVAFRAGYENKPEVKAILSELRSHSFKTGLELCEVHPTSKEEAKLIKLLSCRFGDNACFLEGDWSGWPLNDSIITSRLFVELESKTYSLARHALSYHLRDAIEALIATSDPSFFKRRYEPARNRYLENTALAYFRQALPGCEAHQNLFYTITDNGDEKRCELDGLALFDTNLILIEAKAGSLSVSARRGSISRLRKDISNLIDKPFGQCLRASEYIRNNTPSTFYDTRNREVCRIDPSAIRNVFLVTVTLDSLGPISGDLNTVRRLGLATGAEWFWSVGIHDLRIIAELSEFPTQFLHYLQRRLRINTQPAIKSIDEIDLFGVYLSEGLFFEDWELQNTNLMSFDGYTDSIDDYYYHAEAGKGIAKPTQDIPPSFKRLLMNIESTQKSGFSDVTLALLDMDGHSREQFAKLMDERVADVLASGTSRNFTMLFDQLSRGISVMIMRTITQEAITTAKEYCTKKRSKLAHPTWICVLIGVNERSFDVDFFVQESG